MATKKKTTTATPADDSTEKAVPAYENAVDYINQKYNENFDIDLFPRFASDNPEALVKMGIGQLMIAIDESFPSVKRKTKQWLHYITHHYLEVPMKTPMIVDFNDKISHRYNEVSYCNLLTALLDNIEKSLRDHLDFFKEINILVTDVNEQVKQNYTRTLKPLFSEPSKYKTILNVVLMEPCEIADEVNFIDYHVKCDVVLDDRPFESYLHRSVVDNTVVYDETAAYYENYFYRWLKLYVFLKSFNTKSFGVKLNK